MTLLCILGWRLDQHALCTSIYPILVLYTSIHYILGRRLDQHVTKCSRAATLALMAVTPPSNLHQGGTACPIFTCSGEQCAIYLHEIPVHLHECRAATRPKKFSPITNRGSQFVAHK